MATKNLFLNALASKDTVTLNGAISNSTTNSVLVDQFGTAANYRNRPIEKVFEDQELLWMDNKEMSVRFPFYLRMVTRKVKVHNNFVTDNVQNGQGVRDESFKRLLWFAKNQSNIFYQNIWLLPMVGSWKDLWTIMFYDISMDINSIDRKVIYELIKQGIACEEHIELIKKFMPRIKSKSKLTTDWTRITNQLAKEFAEYLGISAKEYNKFKASGTAHEFQKMICSREYDKINWNLIPGRALNLIANSKFLTNHNLEEEYVKWLMEQPTAKFTGYVYELAKQVRDNIGYNFWGGKGNDLTKLPLHKRVTIDKQFDELIKKAKENGKITENVWCALDTSGSMGSLTSCGVSAFDIGTALGVFFSTLNEGSFHKNVIMFDNVSSVKQLNGSFSEMLTQIPYNAMGGTNFQSVVDEICRIRHANPNIPLEDYPSTLLVVSDMGFNPTNNWRYQRDEVLEQTNYEAMKSKLYECFPTEFVDNMKFIWWNVSSKLNDFPSQINDGGTYLFSGYDGSIINMLLGEEVKPNEPKKQKTMMEMVLEALNQEILQQVKL